MAAKTTKDDPGFAAAFTGLKRLMKPYEKKLSVLKNEPDYYYLETKSSSLRGKPAIFGAVRVGSYVSFHFFPVYMYPEMLKSVSPELKKRMQGKACFNFKAVDKELFAQMARLLEAGFRRYETEGLL